MNRKDFGHLLATLRQELDWTQFQFAEFAGVDEAIISQIERGVKKFFEPDLLFHLANALHLTTLERREFFLAASGLEQGQIVRQPSLATNTDVFNARKMLDKLVELTGQVRLPAFLGDVYGDAVATNAIIITFLQIPPYIFESAPVVPAGYNTTRANFSKDGVMRERVVDNWDNFAVNAMRSFREHSLRYRTQPYFKYLMKIFRNPAEYPLFDRYWKMVSSIEQDKEISTDHFEFQHSHYGPVKYTAATTVTITSFGELFLVQYLPMDEATSHIFEGIAAEVGQRAVRVAPWPIKNFPG